MAPVYGFCDANCKQPVYTVGEITTILEQLIQGGSLDKIDPALLPIVAAIREQHNNKDIKFWLGTEAELNAIDPVVTTKLLMPRIDGENNLYLCSDDSTLETWKNEILAAARALVTGYATNEQLQTVSTAANNAATAAAEAKTAASNHAGSKSNPHGVTASQVGLGNVTNNKQMPIGGGDFTGNAKAYETARTTRGLFNEETRASSTTGTLQSIKYFINVT